MLPPFSPKLSFFYFVYSPHFLNELTDQQFNSSTLWRELQRRFDFILTTTRTIIA